MQKSSEIDGAWFKEQFERAGLSMREVARRLPAGKRGKPMDPSALSRALNGTRKLTVSEARHIARILQVNEKVVMEKVLGRADANAQMATPEPIGTQPQGAQAPLRRHPAWGALKGTTIVMPGVDLTEPTTPEWGQLDEQ